MLLPPSAVRGMKALNKELFRKTVKVPALQTTRDRVRTLLRDLKMNKLDGLCVKSVCDVTPPEEGAKQLVAILLKPDFKLSPAEEKCLTDGTELVERELLLEFASWPIKTLLTAILPENLVVPSAFETAGHIAHVNLRDEQLPYKQVIGEVLLEKLTSIKTVVNKLGKIENEFRVFDMEVGHIGSNNLVLCYTLHTGYCRRCGSKGCNSERDELHL